MSEHVHGATLDVAMIEAQPGGPLLVGLLFHWDAGGRGVVPLTVPQALLLADALRSTAEDLAAAHVRAKADGLGEIVVRQLGKLTPQAGGEG